MWKVVCNEFYCIKKNDILNILLCKIIKKMQETNIKEDFLFFYYLSLLKQNLSMMKKISKAMSHSKQRYLSPFDMFFVYVYVVLGLQADYSFQFIMYYYKKYVEVDEAMEEGANFFQEVLVD